MGLCFARIPPQRLQGTKAAFTVRRVARSALKTLITGEVVPSAGDLVLARVRQIGQHAYLQLICGRRTTLFPGDEIIICYGNRYAVDQFEGYVPESLAPCHLAAGGGIASFIRSQHSKMHAPTMIEPIGLIGDELGLRLNLRHFALPSRNFAKPPRLQIVVVAGTEMNSGKTTTAGGIIHGCVKAGFRVAALKLTGTGAGGDYWQMVDAGASPVFDFTDAGYASTFQVEPVQLEEIFQSLLAHATDSYPDVIVMEIADGLMQPETAALMTSAPFRAAVDAIVFAANDSLGAAAGVERLRQWELPVVGVSGVVTASQLGREAAELATGVSAYSKSDLAKTSNILEMLPALQSASWDLRARKNREVEVSTERGDVLSATFGSDLPGLAKSPALFDPS
jgi:hypothetical protein